MGRADDLASEYAARLGTPAGRQDVVYGYQVAVLRDMLRRLEVILTDEGVDPAVGDRVMRGLLYGWPSTADAELREAQLTEIAWLRSSTTRQPWTPSRPGG